MVNRLQRSMQEKGFTYLGKVGEKKLFCNLKSEESIKKCLECLESATSEGWGIFTESSGNKVFYKKSMYYLALNYLVFCGDSKCIELPLNCRDANFLFYATKFEKASNLNDLDFSHIKNFDHIFDLAEFKDGFELNIDVSSAISMQYAFCDCILGDGFAFGDKFNTCKVKSMHSMFRRAFIGYGTRFGSNFYLNCDLDGMFAGTTFCGSMFVENGIGEDATNIRMMFDSDRFERVVKDSSDPVEILEFLATNSNAILGENWRYLSE